MVAKRQRQDAREPKGFVGGMSGNRFDKTKEVVRDGEGNIVREPGEVVFVADEIRPVEEEAREKGKV